MEPIIKTCEQNVSFVNGHKVNGSKLWKFTFLDMLIKEVRQWFIEHEKVIQSQKTIFIKGLEGSSINKGTVAKVV